MLTASDAATAIGVNKYEKPDDLILKKCGLNKFNGNEATEHGNKYENIARDIYCEKYPNHRLFATLLPRFPAMIVR